MQNLTSNIQCSGLDVSSSGPWSDSSNGRINSSHRQDIREPPDAFPACSGMKLTKPNGRKGTYARPWKRCAGVSSPEPSNSHNPGRAFFKSEIVPNRSHLRTDRSQCFSLITNSRCEYTFYFCRFLLPFNQAHAKTTTASLKGCQSRKS